MALEAGDSRPCGLTLGSWLERADLKSFTVETIPESDPVSAVRLVTAQGVINCRLHRPSGGDAAVLWVFGSGGGLGGPAGGVYERLGRRFADLGAASLQLDYRRPGRLRECVDDVLVGIGYLAELGKSRIVLVGHSFGGAVVISAGIESDNVVAVAAMSSQTGGAERAAMLAPKPLLLIHGTADEILPHSCSLVIHQKAQEPKELILYEGCRHGLDQCREELDRDLTRWLRQVLEL